MKNLLDKLRGGDLRSIGRSNEVVADIEKEPSLIEDVFAGLRSDDPVLRARSADAIEKATRNKPELLSKHKTEVIALLKNDTQQEVCWHIAQMIPRLQFTPSEEKIIIEALKKYLTHKSKIVRAFAMEALVDLAEGNKKIVQEVMLIIQKQIAAGSPAIQARGRKLLKRFERTKAAKGFSFNRLHLICMAVAIQN